MSDISQDPGLGPSMKNAAVDARTLSASPEARSTEFVAVTGPEGEGTSATSMLVTAYVLFWLFLLGFVWMTWRRQFRLTERLKVVESQVARLNAGERT